MKVGAALVSFVLYISCPLAVSAQEKHVVPIPIAGDSIITNTGTPPEPNKYNNQIDLIDLITSIGKDHVIKRVDTGGKAFTRPKLSAVPAAGYTLLTGFAAIAVGNVAFYTNHDTDAKVSNVLANITYSVKKQIIIPVQTNIWTKNNKYNIVLDWRYLKYPSYTYGLGTSAPETNGYNIDYSEVHFKQRVFRKVAYNLYLGVGYDVQYVWDIKEVNPPATKQTDFESYGLSKTEYASGITLNFLYDTRKNSINPGTSEYLNVIYSPHLLLLGNQDFWRSLIVDARKYIQLPFGSDNVLAFWNYDWLTLSGTPPYLLLPSTGGDAYSNTGRGYIQGRFRGKNMLYFEGEYRFGISHDGLFGGVVFANAQSFSEESSSKFTSVAPGYGVGLRVKLNKFSKTNIAIDYGLGTSGTGGFFVNLGEVF